MDKSLSLLRKIDLKGDALLQSKLGNSLKLNSKSQAAAAQILKRENTNAKKSRFECLLIQQFTSKYGTKNPASQVNTCIQLTIKDFLDSFDNMAEAESMLDTLEDQIRDVTAALKRKIQQQIIKTAVKQNDIDSNAPLKSNSASNNSNTSRENIEANDWLVVNAILAACDEEKRKTEMQTAHMKKIKFKEGLEQQLATVRSNKSFHDVEKNRARDYIASDLSKLEEEKRALSKMKAEKVAREKKITLDHIEHNRVEREREKEEQKSFEQRRAERALMLQAEEEELRRKKKEEDARRRELIVRDNELNQIAKEEAKRKQWEYEAKLNRDYEEKLEREDRARSKAFEDRIEALRRAERHYEMGSGAKLKEEMALTEQRTLNAMAQKERNDELREHEKQAKRRQDMEKSLQFNRMLMDKKKSQKELELKEATELRLRMEKDANDFRNQEKMKHDQRLTKMKAMKDELSSQALIKRSEKKSALSGIELELNKSIIKKIHDDPNIYDRVIERIHPTNIAAPVTSSVKF